MFLWYNVMYSKEVIMKESKFYKILRPFIWLFVHVFIRPVYVGLDNIPKSESVILAGRDRFNEV